MTTSTERAGAGVEPAPALRRAVRGYLDHLTVERGLAANTLASYRRDLDRYLATLAAAGVTDLAAVGTAEIEGHLARLRAGDAEHPPLAVSSAARAASAVRGLHRFAVREGLAGGDPARDVRPPTPARRLPRALPVDDVLRLLEAAGPVTATGDTAPRALRDRALLEFLYGTGARISEAVGAAVDDLDLDEGAALLRGKGGRTRLVPIGGYAVAAVRAWLVRGRPALLAAGRGTPAVFVNARGGPLTRQGAWAVLRGAAERAGLPVTGPGAVSPHTLRHSYATHLLDGGADVRVVQELLGHASVTTTQVYTLVTVERLREVYATAHPRARD
ncbi:MULTISPECIES: site-specific tyrosine recombinase XerD [Micromonospora]|uniref:Tyrosine recombinase XerD n=1 Tax=Micromonospora solifontis TaxID=2487138 RepID=A0ABX9WIH9_9ACTN|nr:MULTISPECIES: site-specific tyrosine recombinase XerD [Micromonospora]NES16516.1 site-specific tyrosine recombinase XerD [Micromonospora sp. PPF5-17B]NES37442.1 site-specific tyrosine recombinase XerD [Micromonospora solifontis]NES58200.1 site-specific tyrosine recombinase XerD [Micromonospora sp. PPF5-6]RNL98373.1 site-specific tyrosine recombinase XerD [Micromonospora solifontis]